MKKHPEQNEQFEAQLRNLPDTVNQSLAGLTAGTELNNRIQMAVRDSRASRQKKSFPLRRFVSVAGVCAVAVALFVGLSPLLASPANAPLIQSSPLGDKPTATERTLRADLTGSDVSIGQKQSVPSYRNLWSSSSDGSTFPLIGVNGSYYRMMTSPRSVSSSLLGASLGTIAEYTTEPSLSGTNVILSNKAAVGTEVYGISGMSSTFVAAEVDGQIRLFQRVSFNGNALKGSETLADVMQLSGHVASIELSGVGTITDTSVCADLISLLLNDATYESSGSLSAKQSLLIELDNGLVYQFTVKNDKIASCGTWSCPEFFEAFEAACE